MLGVQYTFVIRNFGGKIRCYSLERGGSLSHCKHFVVDKPNRNIPFQYGDSLEEEGESFSRSKHFAVDEPNIPFQISFFYFPLQYVHVCIKRSSITPVRIKFVIIY